MENRKFSSIISIVLLLLTPQLTTVISICTHDVTLHHVLHLAACVVLTWVDGVVVEDSTPAKDSFLIKPGQRADAMV